MKKIPVGILGATGMVGQKFIEMLADHPWFEIVALAASERSYGKPYSQAMRWMMDAPLAEHIARMMVKPCEPDLPCQVVFSGLDSDVAGGIEQAFAQAGYIVISNSRNHRMDPDVPLLIPEVNSPHLDLVKSQKYGEGMIVTNPNCSVIGLATALKPIADLWGIDKVNVVTMQAISGAGYPGVPSFDILDNVIPFISGEEDKVETEPLKILGKLHGQHIQPYPMTISAQCNRVAVMNGHTECLSVKLHKEASTEELITAWQNFSAEPQALRLPTAPKLPIVYLTDERHPQPKIHRLLEKGMAVSIGRLRKCPILDWKFVLLSHNTIRGAAGCAILNAELMVAKGYIPRGSMPAPCIKVFAPATVANVACGFDIFGFALENPGDELIVTLKDTPGVTIKTITGDDGSLPHDPLKNTAGVSVLRFLEHLKIDQGVEIELHKKMPLGSGLGSSAASAAGSLFALNTLLGHPLSVLELLPFAMEGERAACGAAHADNVAPSLLGGFILIRSYSPLDVIKITTPLNLYCTILHPRIEIRTEAARKILPKSIPLVHHIIQTGNAAGLIAGLMEGNIKLIKNSLTDVIVEPVRSSLIPGFHDMKAAALDKGALGCSISGAGPSLFALSLSAEHAAEIGDAMEKACKQNNLECDLYLSPMNPHGPKVLPW